MQLMAQQHWASSRQFGQLQRRRRSRTALGLYLSPPLCLAAHCHIDGWSGRSALPHRRGATDGQQLDIVHWCWCILIIVVFMQLWTCLQCSGPDPQAEHPEWC